MTAIDPVQVMRRRATATGLTVAAAAVPYTFQRTLMTRSNLDQAITTGLSFTLTQAIVTGVQDAIQSGALLATGEDDGPTELTHWSRNTMVLDASAAIGGAAVSALLRRKPHESLRRASSRLA